MQTRSQRTRAGFTLAELMVVIVIIGLLAVLVVPNVMQKLSRANVTKAKADITAIASAIDSYAIQNGGRYPASFEALLAPDELGHSYLYYESMPLDPWGHPYLYEPAPSGSKPRVLSHGKDGQPGGQGDDADIDSIQIKKGGG